MDNLSIHYAKRVRDFFNDRVMQRYIPKYSCTLNPIERLWLVVKEKWRRAMLEHLDNLDHEGALKLMRSLLDEQKELCKSLSSSHLKTIIMALKGEFV